MRKPYRMSDNEKELLHLLGEHPDMSVKELVASTKYKWERTVKRKLKLLKEQEILLGPFYDLNYTKLCKNPLHKLVCIIETNQSYDAVFPYLRIIEPLKWVYPVLSPHKKLFTAGFFSSNDAAIRDVLQLLKDSNIITDYIVRVWNTKRLIKHPNFFGEVNPSLDNLLNPCEYFDLSLPHYDTVWNECDMAILPYMEGGIKLVDILREEKKQRRTWTYDQIKYSREKMVRNGLIEKLYVIHPFPPEQCAHFQLFFKTGDIELTERVLHNFAEGERVSRQYVLCEGWGKITCVSHPLFLKDLNRNLDSIDEIVEREIFPKRSFPPGRYCVDQPSDYTHFNFEAQTLKYPYHIYEEEIKEKIERDQLVISV